MRATASAAASSADVSGLTIALSPLFLLLLYFVTLLLLLVVHHASIIRNDRLMRR